MTVLHASKQAGQTTYYYVRIEQSDGKLAWASPMWIKIGFGRKEFDLYEECFQRGLERGEFVVRSIEPERSSHD